MRPIFVFIWFCCLSALFLISCGRKKKDGGIPIYIEVEDMDPQLEKCFSDKLYGKWASIDDLKPHDKSERFNGQKPEDKHVFINYNEFDASKDTAGTEKIIVNIYGDGSRDTANTFFQLRRFELEPEGIWTESLNLGNFRLQDRPNDKINPGKVDDEEICDLLVRFCIKASYK